MKKMTVLLAVLLAAVLLVGCTKKPEPTPTVAPTEVVTEAPAVTDAPAEATVAPTTAG